MSDPMAAISDWSADLYPLQIRQVSVTGAGSEQPVDLLQSWLADAWTRASVQHFGALNACALSRFSAS